MRRSADLPPALDLSFTLSGRNISLGLHRNLAMDHRPPVYRVRGDGLERLMPELSKVGECRFYLEAYARCVLGEDSRLMLGVSKVGQCIHVGSCKKCLW